MAAWRGTTQTKPTPKQAEKLTKNGQFVVVAIATKEKVAVCIGVAGTHQAAPRLGAAVPLQAGGAWQAAPIPALCLRSLE